MVAETFPFKIGDFECLAINDGTFAYHDPAELFFTNATKEELSLALSSHGITLDEWKEYLSPFTCLLVRTSKNIILIDTGAGSGAVPGLGKLPNLIREAGFPPEGVDIILNTHGHPDHIGGNTSPNGSVIFPNAQYLILKAEWEYWSSESVLADGGFFAQMVRKNMLAISDRFNLFEPDLEIVPGILVIAAPGHTPGNIAVSIQSRGEELLAVSDAILQPVQVQHPFWYSQVDIFPELTVATRLKLIEKAAREHALVLAFHFPFPGLGYIHSKGDSYHWEPVT